jgi:phosphatidylserine/phosphatidylglycerophosphate/cardiolipin synthase-like enzyme
VSDGAIWTRTLRDGGQEPIAVAHDVAEFVAAARRTLDLALYDVRLPAPAGDVVADALRAAAARGVAVRIAYNEEHRHPVPVPPPPRTKPDLLAALGVPIKGIPGEPDLMHHKYVVRDGEAVWTGSTNWTADSWSREENVLVAVESTAVAAAYAHDFAYLWRRGRVDGSGDFDTRAAGVGDALVRPWFCPGRGDALAHHIATALGRARRRARIASPVLTSGPILGTLAEMSADGHVDLAGVLDATQIEEVYGQWAHNQRSSWKLELLRAVIGAGGFTGKRSTPYRPGSVHDYMHAKVTVVDDTVFVGSFNLSHSGELNAENVLEIEHAPLAEEMAGFVDSVRALYPAAPLPSSSGSRPATRSRTQESR